MAALLLIAPATLAAQDDVTAHRIGDIRYDSGTVNRQPVPGSTRVIGEQAYTHLRLGDRSLRRSSCECSDG